MFRISQETEIPGAIRDDLAVARLWRPFRCAAHRGWVFRGERFTLAGAPVCWRCALDYNEMVGALGAEYAEERDRETRRVRREALYGMQDHCGVSTPDSDSSPGADWLYWLHNAVSEAWDSGRFGPDSGEDETDVISEIADAHIPIYTHNRWQVFTDLCLYSEDVELYGDTDNADKLTGAIASVFSEIANWGMNSWISEKRENSKCEKCDEFPCECCEECGEYFDCECSTNE